MKLKVASRINLTQKAQTYAEHTSLSLVCSHPEASTSKASAQFCEFREVCVRQKIRVNEFEN